MLILNLACQNRLILFCYFLSQFCVIGEILQMLHQYEIVCNEILKLLLIMFGILTRGQNVLIN